MKIVSYMVWISFGSVSVSKAFNSSMSVSVSGLLPTLI